MMGDRGQRNRVRLLLVAPHLQVRRLCKRGDDLLQGAIPPHQNPPGALLVHVPHPCIPHPCILHPAQSRAQSWDGKRMLWGGEDQVVDLLAITEVYPGLPQVPTAQQEEKSRTAEQDLPCS